MDATEAEKQIEQMCRFIEQEAREKVDEITMKTDQDHDKEEQTLLVEGRIALKAEFDKKLKELSVRKRMYVANTHHHNNNLPACAAPTVVPCTLLLFRSLTGTVCCFCG